MKRITFSLNPFQIFVIFLIFKLTDVITWSWWYVFLPLFIHVAIQVFLVWLFMYNEKRTYHKMWNTWNKV